MLKALKEYIASVKCSIILKDFFENPLGENWYWFVHNNSYLFDQTFLNVEGDKICTTEAALVYLKLIDTLSQSKRNIFTN